MMLILAILTLLGALRFRRRAATVAVDPVNRAETVR
jgi:hypothetical protein